MSFLIEQDHISFERSRSHIELLELSASLEEGIQYVPNFLLGKEISLVAAAAYLFFQLHLVVVEEHLKFGKCTTEVVIILNLVHGG